ncbi:hypothetical protein FSP39_002549 [Pinctada imbricata]|uniref:G-protein coupled receptors family 2 profile 2 domain-containing protein n=1 Tax=Pinctada imbricata TaxID=66713 RepID=A0AA88YMN5_PINIB|nr:hypothetical protein FSP39_002549 [Pinctada imbricata]
MATVETELPVSTFLYTTDSTNVTSVPSWIIPNTLPTSVLICTGVASSLSILGAVLIFVTYCTVESARNQTRRLLIYLTISDFLISAGNLLGTIRYALRFNKEITDRDIVRNCRHSDEICVIQSCVTTFASLASFGWTVVIGVHLLTSLVYQRSMGKKPRIISHLICWGVPITITTIAAFWNVLGEDYALSSGPWCWIRGCLRSDNDIIIWMTVTGKGWEILTYVLAANFYIYLKLFMCKQRRSANRRIGYYEQSGSSYLRMRLRDEDEIYVLQWLLLYVLRIWGTVRYGLAMNKIGGHHLIPSYDKVDFVLLHMQSVGDSSHAFFNCILFCFCDKTVRTSILRRLKACCRRQGEYQELIDPALN